MSVENIISPEKEKKNPFTSKESVVYKWKVFEKKEMSLQWPIHKSLEPYDLNLLDLN